MRNFLFALLVLAGCSTPPGSPPPAPAPILQPDVGAVIAADRAMAARAGREGWIEAYSAGASPDAFVLQPGPTPASGFFDNIHPDVRGDTSLRWAPNYAGVARSGDLGFTAGAFNGDGAAFGTYLTVWRRHADGWRWIYQDGTDSLIELPLATEAESVALGAPGSGDAARATLSSLEANLRVAAATNGGAALASVLAPTGRMDREYKPMAIGPDAARASLGPAPITYGDMLLTEVSEAGDLAFVLGVTEWEGAHGYYARIWALTPDGWRVVYDQVIERFEATDTTGPSDTEQ